jgi:hypothetical protein
MSGAVSNAKKICKCGVLIIEFCGADSVHARIHEDAISREEAALLCFREEVEEKGIMRWYIRGKESGTVDDLVYTALSKGFNFRGEPDRARWKNRQAFEMYRYHL